MSFFLAIDQGTTSCRAIVYDKKFQPIAIAQKEITQFFPHSDWVEHDADEIWTKQLACCKEAIKKAGIEVREIISIGITNQRETVVAWDKRTDNPIYRAIVWQDRRTAAACMEDEEKLGIELLSTKTGLRFDAYFSASKIRWILENIPTARKKADKNELCVGTIDSWILWKLTRGAVFATDVSNASRTNLFNIKNIVWDEALLHHFQIPKEILPEVKPSIGNWGKTSKDYFGVEISINGIAGDQQASLYGHGCFDKGSIKNTFGTGCFILQNTGNEFVMPQKGLLTTLAWGEGEAITYAIEGSVFNAGSAIQWLKDGLGIIQSYDEIEEKVQSVPDSDDVYFVPAFTGIGTPHWDMYARGTIVGISRRTQKEHIIRATLESLAYQSKDVIDTMTSVSGGAFKDIRVDGGASKSNFLLQFLTNILQVPIRRNASAECTALGVVMMAAKGSGFYNHEDLKNFSNANLSFFPDMPLSHRDALYEKWKMAVDKSLGWAR
jgi:glycerol kinase